MRTAIIRGDARKLAELISRDPGFDVNIEQDEHGQTLLYYACFESWCSPVIPLLLAHPGIDINLKNRDGWTPFYSACENGRISCVRELLKDSRVKVNEPDNIGHTPLRIAAADGHFYIIKWWIACGREMDLGKPGDEKTDAIGRASWQGRTEVVTLLEDSKRTRRILGMR